MDVEIFTVCDAATVSGGKLNILGSFDRVHSAHFPFQYPELTVAYKVRFDVSEAGEHSKEVRLIDLDGRALVPAGAKKFTVAGRPEDGGGLLHIGMDRHYGLPFVRPGEFHLDLVIDGRVRSRIPLLARLVPARGEESWRAE